MPFTYKYIVGIYGIMLIVFSAELLAGPVGDLNTFQSGTSISSSDMNENFTEVKTAVDGNAADIATNTGNITANTNGIVANTSNVVNNRLDINTNTNAITALQSPQCPTGMVDLVSFCIDTYEASDAGGEINPSVAGCMADGSSCSTSGLSIQSVSGVIPVGSASWFQAIQLCQLAGKRLPTNLEWQLAATGTDTNSGGAPGAPGSRCNSIGGVTIATGANASCVSDSGAFDMVGNRSEWVSDYTKASGTDMRMVPMLTRGGSSVGAASGEYTLGESTANILEPTAGFRCAADK